MPLLLDVLFEICYFWYLSENNSCINHQIFAYYAEWVISYKPLTNDSRIRESLQLYYSWRNPYQLGIFITVLSSKLFIQSNIPSTEFFTSSLHLSKMNFCLSQTQIAILINCSHRECHLRLSSHLYKWK